MTTKTIAKVLTLLAVILYTAAVITLTAGQIAVGATALLTACAVMFTAFAIRHQHEDRKMLAKTAMHLADTSEQLLKLQEALSKGVRAKLIITPDGDGTVRVSSDNDGDNSDSKDNHGDEAEDTGVLDE